MENNAYLNAKKQLKSVFALTNEYSENDFELISNPKRIIEVNIPVLMDN
jgi:hypothetical protein